MNDKYYQYIGTNINLEENCILDMNEDLEEISITEALKLIGVSVHEADCMFPFLEKGTTAFFKGVFDNNNCLVYQLKGWRELPDDAIQMVWIEI